MHRHRISLLPSTRTPIRSPNGILRGRRRIIRQECGKPLRPASTERPGEQKPPPEGSKGLPPREQRSPRWEQRSPYRGAKVSPMGFKVCSRAAKVSPEGSKGLPLKEAKFSTSLAKVSPKGIEDLPQGVGGGAMRSSKYLEWTPPLKYSYKHSCFLIEKIAGTRARHHFAGLSL